MSKHYFVFECVVVDRGDRLVDVVIDRGWGWTEYEAREDVFEKYAKRGEHVQRAITRTGRKCQRTPCGCETR